MCDRSLLDERFPLALSGVPGDAIEWLALLFEFGGLPIPPVQLELPLLIRLRDGLRSVFEL